MSYEEAKEALSNLYDIFDRGIVLQKFGTAKDSKEDVEEVLEDFRIDDYLKEGSVKGDQIITPKLKKVFALVDALGEFSEELFGIPSEKNFIKTYMELRSQYFNEKTIPDDFLKRTDFLNVFKEKLNVYLK